MQFLCTTCSKVWDEEELKEKEGVYVCPDGNHHDIYHLEEACDIVNMHRDTMTFQEMYINDE